MNEQALKDSYDVFVSNGYTKSFEEYKKLINSNPQALKDSYDVFVSNGYSKSIDEYKVLMGVGAQPAPVPVVKKKDSLVSATPQQQPKPTTASSLASGSLATPATKKKTPKEEEEDYWDNLGTTIMAGVNDVNKMISSIPETAYNLFSIPQNAIAYATGWDIATNSEKFKKNFGVENPILNHYKEEGKKLEKEISQFNQKNYKTSSVYENIKGGNYQDAFELLGTSIARSAPTSIAIMSGGAVLGASELAAVSTAGFYNQNLEDLQEENPDASDIENNVKALGMAAAESVFSAIGEGQIGAVYRDIIKKEGAEVGKQVFKDGLIEMYKGALKKYGVPIGLLGEGIEESATQITQNMISGKPVFEGVADAFITGGGSGVMFTAPISLKNAKDRIKGKITEIDDKKKINTILEGSDETFNNVFNVSKDSEINEKQLSIASLSKSRDLLVKDLKENVKKGDITEDEAKQSLYIFDKIKQITGQLRDIDVDEKSKVKIANLLKERESLSEKIQGKDEALSVLEKQRISEINDEIKQTILKSKEDAVQEQTTDESVLRTEQPELELQGVGEGNAKKETITTAQAKVEIPDWYREEYEQDLKRYEESIANSKKDLEEEKSRNFLSRSKKWIKYYEDAVKFDEDKIKLLKENPIEFYKQELNDVKKNHEERLLDNESTYKQDLIDNYGTTDFEVINSRFIENTNRKISDYEAVQKTANENAKQITGAPDEVSQPIELSVTPSAIEVTPTPQGLPDEVSQPIDLSIQPPAPETVSEVVTEPTPVVETPVVEEVTPVAETPVAETPVVEKSLLKETTEKVDSIKDNESFDLPDGSKIIKEGDSFKWNRGEKGIRDVSREVAIRIANNIISESKSGQNISLKDYNTETVNGNELKVGDVYVRDENGTRYVYRLLGKPKVMSGPGSFWVADVEVLSIGKQPIEVLTRETSNEIGKVSEQERRVGKKTIDRFKSPSKDRALFGKVKKINNWEEVSKPTEIKAESTPVAAKPLTDKVQQRIAQIDNAIDVLFETNGPDTSTWVNPASNYDLITLRRAKKAFESDAQSVKTFLNTRMGERYSEIEFKFEDLKEAPTPKPKAKPKAAPKTKFEDKAKKIADEIMKLELPDWAVAEGAKGAANQGVDSAVLKRAFADSVIKLGQLMDAGVEFSKALKEASKDLVGLLGQKNKDRIEDEILNKFNKGEKLSEQALKGYDKFSSVVDSAIANGKTIDNIMNYMERSDVYKRANNVQKELLIREVRKKFGLSQKSAPSVGKLFGTIKDIKKITMTEKAALAKQLRDKARGARESVTAFRLASQEVAKEIKELKEKGSITATQAANIISKFSKVNLLNESSVSSFVDYMTKVFADADYDNKINIAKGKLKTAKKNINTKIGIADGLIGPLQRLLSINPSLIPIKNLERYIEIVDMFSERKAVLTLDEKSKLIDDVNDILDEINNERSAVDELSQRFNYSENQVIEDGKLNYAATVKNMLKEGEITEEEAELMTKYKSEIIPQVEKSKATDEEIQQEKDELLAEVKKLTINSDELPTRIERDKAKKLASLLKTPAVKELTNAQLKNLLKVIDNINNGYFANSAQLIIEELNSNNNKKSLVSSVERAVLLPLSKIYAKAKSILTKKDYVLEMIRRNPLFNIDQVLGDFKTKDVFNSILEKAAEAEAKFTAELKAIQLKLSNAEEKIAKSHGLNANATLMAKFKMMTYMVQLEYNSNPDSKQVNPAAEFLKATIKHIDEGNSQFKERDADMLQEILDKFAPNGEIDIDKLYNSFNSAEKAGIKTIQEVNQSLREKAEHTASVIRGQRINPLSNYIHLNVLSDAKPNDLQSGESFADQYNNSLKPSTKAKSLIERTGKVSPLNFDVFASAHKGAKFVLMDYNLTEPIRTARKTINKAITELENQGRISKDKRKIINAIKNSFEEAVEGLVQNSYMETSVGDDVVDYIKKQGYRSILAGTGRFAAEFLSNVGFVIISDPTTFSEGLKYTSTLMSPDAPLIMHNVNSKEINRIFPSDTLSGRLIDTNILSQANGIRGGKAKNKVVNKAQQIWNLTGKKYKNAVELTADVLITTPDKAIMRPIWFGAFASNFNKQTGQDIDFEKIAANDEAYMNQNREAIDKAKDAADERSVITGASNNTFTGILKGTSKPNQSNFIKGFNNFNNFMTRFLIYEYTSARTGIMAAMGNGSLSKRQGIALLGAVTTRMTVYSLLSKALGSGLIGLLFGDDDEEEEKSLDKSIGQALTSTFTSLLFNRDFGNATKMFINKGLEMFNEEYLEALREGPYDPYKDAIQYTSIPIEKKGKQTGLYDYAESFSGAFGPAIKTTNLIIKTYSGEDKKESGAIERQEDVKNIRIPLEVLGNAGFIPLYKDIRKTVMNNIYKDLKNPPANTSSYEEYEKSQKEKKVLDSIIDSSYDQDIIDAAEQKKKELIYKGTDYQKSMNKIEDLKKEKLLVDPETGTKYDNEEDLKKYNESLWNENFGPNSDWEQEHKNEDAVNKIMNDALAKEEEAKYNYVKKKKNSDGTRKRSK